MFKVSSDIYITIVGIIGSVASLYGAYISIKAKIEAKNSALLAEIAKNQILKKQRTTNLAEIMYEAKRIQQIFGKYSIRLASSYTGVPNMQDFGQFYSMGSGLSLSAGSNTGIIKFTVGYTGSEWIERMRINSSGNVGINTTQPTSKLQVVGLPEYADNTTAKAGGLTIGAFYHTAGVLKVVY